MSPLRIFHLLTPSDLAFLLLANILWSKTQAFHYATVDYFFLLYFCGWFIFNPKYVRCLNYFCLIFSSWFQSIIVVFLGHFHSESYYSIT